MLLLRATLAVLAVILAAGCGASRRCGPDTCQGCCTADATCVSATSAQACGAGGLACVTCSGGAQCTVGVCQAPDAGTGGGAGGGGGATGPCDVDNGGCDAVATCAPQGASRTCTCPGGSTGDGLTCTPALSSLTVTPSSLAPLFSPERTNYVASIPFSSTLVTVSVATSAPGASILIDGQPTSTRMIPLSAPTRPTAITVRFDATLRSQQYSVLLARARRTVQQAYLKSSAPRGGDAFGTALALSRDGNFLVVGAPSDDGPGSATVDGGVAFVFLRTAGTWTLVQALRPSNPGADDAFGTSVAISSDGAVIAVGAPKEDSDGPADNDASTDSGAVYVFRVSGGTWTQEARLKATLVGAGDGFGASVAISGDGATVAAGGPDEDSASTGVDGDAADDSAPSAGAAWLFGRAGAAWSQQAYLKASNPDARDRFGGALALDDDGTSIAIGATGESSDARVIDGAPDDDSAANAGAVYLFRKTTAWAQDVRLKASNTGAGDVFGVSVGLSGDGQRVVVGAWGEDSGRVGINGPDDDTSDQAGAAYVFARDTGTWREEARLKASNADGADRLGQSVAISRDGASILVGALAEGSSTTGVDGDQSLDNALSSGAAYLFARTTAGWVQETYVKASNTDAGDGFGGAVTLAGDGVSFACGAPAEASNATGVGGDQADDSLPGAGAAYTFTRLPF